MDLAQHKMFIISCFFFLIKIRHSKVLCSTKNIKWLSFSSVGTHLVRRCSKLAECGEDLDVLHAGVGLAGDHEGAAEAGQLRHSGVQSLHLAVVACNQATSSVKLQRGTRKICQLLLLL